MGHRTQNQQPHYQQWNGLAERAVQSDEQLMEKCKRDKSDIYLGLLIFQILNTVFFLRFSSEFFIYFWHHVEMSLFLCSITLWSTHNAHFMLEVSITWQTWISKVSINEVLTHKIIHTYRFCRYQTWLLTKTNSWTAYRRERSTEIHIIVYSIPQACFV